MLNQLSRITKLALAGLAILLFTQGLSASHFRYGHLTWAPAGGNDVDFTLTGAFRWSGYSGTHASGRPDIGDIITEVIGGTRLTFGDNASTPTLQFLVTAISPTDDWLVGVALEPGSSVDQTITHTYASNGPWTAAIDSCCRIGSLKNAGSGGYRVETIVDLSGNSSPVSSLPPIVKAPVGTTGYNFSVPAADADPNTTLFWRFATGAEFGVGSWVAPAAMTIQSGTGVVTWDTPASSVGDLYAIQVVIEDRDSATGAVRTKVSVDFIIELVGQGNAPVFSSPKCGSVIVGSVGVPINFTVTASDSDPGDIVTLNTAGLPAGGTMTQPLPLNGNPVTSQFSWTPTSQGVSVVTFTATDQTGLQSLCSIEIRIAECHLWLGLNQVNIPILSPLDTLLVIPLSSYPVTMTHIPEFAIPNDPGLMGFTLYAQIGMYNYVVFPNDPLQMSNGLAITLGGSAKTYGKSSGIDLIVTQPPSLGSKLKMKFTIR